MRNQLSGNIDLDCKYFNRNNGLIKFKTVSRMIYFYLIFIRKIYNAQIIWTVISKTRSFMCRLLNKNDIFNLVEMNGNILEFKQDKYLVCTVKNFCIPKDLTIKLESKKNIYNLRFDIDGKIKSIDYESVYF